MNKILVIVNGCNCEPYVLECLNSIKNQTHSGHSVVVVDDASIDDTGLIASVFCVAEGWNYHRNENNEGTAYCRTIGQSIAYLRRIDYDVVVWVDMDDILLPNALEVIAKQYEDPECWLTYGNMIYQSTGKSFDVAKLEFKTENFRKEDWKYIHLRTHRKELIYHLSPEDFAGDYLKAYPDINMLYCMLELAGKEHIRVIKEPLYIYRDYHANTCINRFSHEQRSKEKKFALNYPPKKQLVKL